MSRPQDLSWESLVEVTGATVASERGALNAALAQIREASDQLNDEELASEIRYRAKVYRDMWPTISLTPTALAKHWERIPIEAPKPTYAEVKPNECPTCNGDKMVVFATRTIEGGVEGHTHEVEEMAACPDCNSSASTGWWRYDGSRFNVPDPAQVRRRLQR